MRATLFLDVCSHWCLAAMPAARALADLTPDFEVVFAPTKGGDAVGYSQAEFDWYLDRGAGAYGRRMRSDWFDGPQTRTWFANAVAYVGAQICGDPLRVAHAMLSAALEQGQHIGRADVCYEFMGKFVGKPASEIAKLVADPSVEAALQEGNRRLGELSDERPTFYLENAIENTVLLKGMWHKELVAAAGLALLHDQRAYAAAGPPPF